MEKYLAVYMRLSKDDEDLKNNTFKSESDSIYNQRMIIQQYIAEHSELNKYSILEFADDGYTGTNFERPQVKKMLNMARSGSIDCIIVKDLSRFGRNYLEVGDYLEHIFPFLNIRFIAINDNYDSNRYISSTGGLDIAFRNLVYQRYSQDLSEKVKSAMHLKMSKGQYVTHCPYGYMKKDGQKHQMVLDPATAPIVHSIFMAAIGGKKTSEIAAWLNAQHIPPPVVYKKTKRKTDTNTPMWTHHSIIRIIKDYKYTGAMINYKCENVTIRAKVQKKNPKSDWVIVENAHKAIVTHEEFETANAAIRRVSPTKHRHFDCNDRIYYCAYCGRRLRRTYGKNEKYYCATKLYIPDSPCSNISWNRTKIENILLTAYKKHLLLMHENYNKMKQIKIESPIETFRNAKINTEKRLSLLETQNLSLYEQYKENTITKDQFLDSKANLMLEKEQLIKKQNDIIKSENLALQKQDAYESQFNSMKEADKLLSSSNDELLKQMYSAVNKVIVYENEEIDIQWKFDIDFPNKSEYHYLC